MEFKDIMAISGKPGLFKFVAQGRNAVIVENLETGKRISAFTTDRISSFEEISVFTNDGDVSLSEIFKKMTDFLDGKDVPSSKSSPDELKSFFEEILPDYDRDRVYISDIKKIISWYTILHKLDIMKDLLVEQKEEEEDKDKAEEVKATKEEKDTKTTKAPEKPVSDREKDNPVEKKS